MGAGLEGLDRVHLVLNRGGHAGQVVDFIDLDQLKGNADVVGQYGEIGVLLGQPMDILASAAGEVVHTNDVVASLNQLPTQVDSKKAGTAAYQDPLTLLAHVTTPDA